MTAPDGYSPEEWRTVVEAPLLAGMLVSVADLSGPVGLLQEASAMLKSSVEPASASTSAVIRAVAAEIRAERRPDTPELSKDRAEATAALLDGCRRAAAIVALRSPEEDRAFREWLLSVATATAGAAKEGTILGFGGRRVSEAEQRALDQLRDALALGDSGA